MLVVHGSCTFAYENFSWKMSCLVQLLMLRSIYRTFGGLSTFS